MNCYKITGMKSIISWNVNGLRAVHRKGAFQIVLDEDPDILCRLLYI